MPTIEVRFKGNRKDYFRWPDDAETLHLYEPVIVEADRGLDFGRVGVKGDVADAKCAAGCGSCGTGGDEPPSASRSVVRRASQDDIRAANALRHTEDDARIRAMDRVRHHGLEMKVSDAEWQWDRKKLTLYFTAEKRVDFRNLVRDLAAAFKARIELRQIGVRDEAARLGGVGRCGKEYCCSTWLRELSPVSLSLAKDQHLSLNPAQISGGCGRLLCCLKYEHEFYVAARKRFPKEGKALRTARGQERVVAVDIFRERILLRSEEHGPRYVGLVDLDGELAAGAETAALSPAGGPAPEVGSANAAEPGRGSGAHAGQSAGSGRGRTSRPRGSGQHRPIRPAESAGSPEPPRPDPTVPAAGPTPAPTPSPRPKRRRRRRGRPGPDRPAGEES